MGWLIAIAAATLVVLAVAALVIIHYLAVIAHSLDRLRLEVGAGLGVNVDDARGYLDGGHLRELADDLRRKNRREAEAARRSY